MEGKIRVPREVTIGSHTYQVMFDGIQDDTGYDGITLHRKHEVLLNPDQDYQRLRITYIHEILHIVFRILDMDPPESDVVGLGELLGQFLFSNLGIELDFSSLPSAERKVKDAK